MHMQAQITPRTKARHADQNITVEKNSNIGMKYVICRRRPGGRFWARSLGAWLLKDAGCRRCLRGRKANL